MVDFNTPKIEINPKKYPSNNEPESPKKILAGKKLNFKKTPVEPIMAQIKQVIAIGETANDTKNNTIAVRNEMPTAKPSIPSIILNILMITNIHTWVTKNDVIVLKNIGLIFEGNVINSIFIPLKNKKDTRPI